MKNIIKYSIITLINLVFCLVMTISATAQRGGGAHFSGGSSFGGRTTSTGSSARFGGGSFSGAARPSGTAVRGGFSPRVGTVQARAGAYRGNFNSPGLVGVRGYNRGGNGPGAYGHGGSYGHYGWGRHGGYFYYQGLYGSLYYPWLGYNCWYLPYGYDMFYWGDDPYYFSDGLYYQYQDSQYTVVEPPVGALVKKLPSDAKSIVINGAQYYEQNGVYYLPIKMDDGTVQYEIAGKDGELNTDTKGNTSVVPKIGDIVTQLPSDCRRVKLNGEVLYVSEDGIYYQEIKDSNNNKVYKIVGLESDNAGN